MSDLLFFFLYFAGILTLALFIHNAIITIMSNNRHQENNVSISKQFECWEQTPMKKICP